MKRSDFFIRLTTAVLFLAVASYIGVSIYNAVINTYVTITAASFTVEETFSAQGYLVRNETVITDGGDAVLPVVSEGEKVGTGQTVAVEYLSRDALETASELHELRLRVAKLEATGEIVESTRRESVLALSRAVHRGDLSMLDELALDVETYIFADASGSAAQLPALQARLESLERRSAGVRTIQAPVSGVFTHIIDGFEHVRPTDLAGITPGGLAGLFNSPYGTFGAGKLITQFKWYYAATMDADEASALTEGQRITVQFLGAYRESVIMLVESIGRHEDDMCVVVFSTDRGVHNVASLRYARAEVIYNVVSGIRVPKEAIHLDDDGTTFIFLQTGVRAERVNVEILQIYGDSYIVRDGAEAGTPLRAGSTIIVRANNLYHNKIVA